MCPTPFAQSRMRPVYKYLMKVRLAVIHPMSARQITFRKDCKVDTGFNGDILIPFYHVDEIRNLGVRLYDADITLANGRSVPGMCCLARIQKMSDHEFPSPGIEINLIRSGEPTDSLMGLKLLSRWIAEFHGPKKLLTLFTEP